MTFVARHCARLARLAEEEGQVRLADWWTYFARSRIWRKAREHIPKMVRVHGLTTPNRGSLG